MTAAAKRTRGDRVIAFVERYCIVPEGSRVGMPMALEPFQVEFIRAVYDNPSVTTLAILSMAKKNGKTAFIAALILCHVAGPEAVHNSQIVCGAMSRDQAALLYEYAMKMVRLHPRLDAAIHLVPSRKRMFGKTLNVEFKALSADAKRSQGISPLVAILDEIGQITGPKSDFVDAITTAQGAYDNGLLFAISTQAADDSDLFSLMIDDARGEANPHTVCHVYEAAKDCAIGDRAQWKRSNPALGAFRSLKDLEKLAHKAERMPSFVPTFRNLNLNQRVETHSPFVSRDVWKSCGSDLVPYDGTAQVYAALDLSAVSDLTAAVGVWHAAGKWNATCRFWAPENGLMDRVKRDKAPYDVWARAGLLRLTPGNTVDYDFVAAELLEMAAEWNLAGIAFDRWRIELFKAALRRQDAPDGFIESMRPFGQGFKDMSPAVDALEKSLLNGLMAHANHPVLAMCAANARVSRDEAGNRKFDKRTYLRRIDGVVALAMAHGIAVADQPADDKQPQLFFIG